MTDDRTDAVSVSSPDRERPVLAVDIGTTFVEVALVESRRGPVVAHARVINKQMFFGTNVLARLSAALDGQTVELQEAVHLSILDAISQLGCGSIDEVLALCHKIVIAANSVMAPLFCAVVPRGLAQAPFVPCQSLCLSSGVLLERFCQAQGRTVGCSDIFDNYVYHDGSIGIEILSPVAGFVGGDARGALLATGLDRVPDPSDRLRGNHPREDAPAYLMVDLGTNAEIALRRNTDLFVTSVPAGPTFEGMFGNGQTDWRGTDVIEHLAKARAAGAIDTTGRVVDTCALAPFAQEDVRDFQLAKAALRAGIDVLLQKARCRPDEVAGFMLVGAFGARLDAQAARVVGLFPSELPQPAEFPHIYTIRGRQIDLSTLNNAALIGGILVALGKTPVLAGTTTHVELATDAGFSHALLDALAFE